MYKMYRALSANCPRNETGATAVEYALILAFIVVVLISVITLFGESLFGALDNITDEISNHI